MVDAQQLTQQADEASARREREEAALYRHDGSKVYGEEEHAERLDVIVSRRDADIADLVEQAEQATAQAQARLDGILNRDPLDRLSEAELARAGGRRAFVKEDAEDLPIGVLAARLKSVAAEGDRAMIALWGRYASRRAAAELALAQEASQAGRPLGPEHSGALRDLREATEAIEKKLDAPGRKMELKAARDRLEGYKNAALHARSRSHTHEEALAMSSSPFRNF